MDIDWWFLAFILIGLVVLRLRVLGGFTKWDKFGGKPKTLYDKLDDIERTIYTRR